MKTLRRLSSSSSGMVHAGTARVIVLRGHGLLAADKGEMSDPYVVLQAAGGEKAKTSVKKGTVNPVWDETLELSVPDYASPVYLEVWDHDTVGMNDSLGAGEIPLEQCEPGTPTLFAVAIDKQGTVEVEVTWLPAEREQHGHAPVVTESSSLTIPSAKRPPRVARPSCCALTQSSSAAVLSPMSSKADGPAAAGTGVATVRVLRGSNLRAADRGGKSDPYVLVQVAGGKKAKTTVKKGTLNPVWDETLELSVPDAAEPLSLSVWDHDAVGMNDSLGSGVISLAQCTPGLVTPLTLALFRPGESQQGTIAVEVLWRPPEKAALVPVVSLSPVQLAAKEAAREAAAARQVADAAAEAYAASERLREEMREKAEAATAAAGVAKAAKRVAAKEADAKEAVARMAAESEKAEAAAREKAAKCMSGLVEMPPAELQSYHRLIIHVEHCIAKRPSPMGSLQGAAERYASSFQLFQDAVWSCVELCGSVPSASPDVVIVANNLGYRPPPSGNAEEAFPRLGSFEVSVTLYDTRTGQRWGPSILYSKLASCKFPAIVKLLGRVHSQIAEWISLPPTRSSPTRPQSAQARRSRGPHGHSGLGFSGSEGALLDAATATMVSELQQENETLRKEHTAIVSELQQVNATLREEHSAMQRHVGALEGEMAAMRAEMQAIRKEMVGKPLSTTSHSNSSATKQARPSLLGHQAPGAHREADGSTHPDSRVVGIMGSMASTMGSMASTMGFGHNETVGTVAVRVLRATGLMAADRGGTSDPYVVVQSGGKKVKTSVKKRTLNPVWDETLELSVRDAAAPLHCEVWDYDAVGMNDSLGAFEILLAQCEPGMPTALTVALSTQGTIEVVVTFSPAESAAEKEELTELEGKNPVAKKATKEVEEMVAAAKAATAQTTEAEAEAISAKGGSFAEGLHKMGSKAGELTRASTMVFGRQQPDEPVGTVAVRVLRATGLMAADRGGTSDPYVVAQMGSKKGKTSVKKKTINPEWDDEIIELSVPDVSAPLSLEVWDHNIVGMNESLGMGQVFLAECKPGTPTALTVALSTQGTVEVVVTFSPAAAMDDAQLAAAKQIAAQPPAASVAVSEAELKQPTAEAEGKGEPRRRRTRSFLRPSS